MRRASSRHFLHPLRSACARGQCVLASCGSGFTRDLAVRSVRTSPLVRCLRSHANDIKSLSTFRARILSRGRIVAGVVHQECWIARLWHWTRAVRSPKGLRSLPRRELRPADARERPWCVTGGVRRLTTWSLSTSLGLSSTAFNAALAARGILLGSAHARVAEWASFLVL